MNKNEEMVVATHQKSMGYLLAKAHLLFRARMAATLEGTSLNMGHVVLLASLLAKNDLTQVELAQISGIEKSSIVLFLDVLEGDGWIERRRHPSDRRAHQVHLTDSGRDRFNVIGQGLYARESEALSVFTEQERAALTTSLLRLITHLER